MRNYFSVIDEITLAECVVCHKPTLKKVIHEGSQSERITPARCACWLAARRREELEALDEEREAYQRRKSKEDRANCFTDPRTSGSTFKADRRPNSEPSKIARAFVDKYRERRMKGQGILFYGPPGVGKSFLAACICNALTDQGYKCLFTNTWKMIEEIEKTFTGKQERLEQFGKYDLVVLDDFGAERATEYKQELITMIVDCLYRHRVPVIITSNRDYARMIRDNSDLFAMRIYSRICEMCQGVKIDGKDMRKER